MGIFCVFCLSNAIHCMGQNIKSLAACVLVCVCVCAHRFWGWISRKRLQIEVRLQWGTNRKWHMADRLVTWPMTSRDLERSRSWPRYIKCPLSWNWLEIETRLLYNTYRKWHLGNQMVTWPMTSRDLEKSRSWPRYKQCQLSRKWSEIETRLQ